MTRHVIVGGGIAGLSAALEIRRLDADAQITLVQSESHPTYFRAGLSRWMTGGIDDAQLTVRPAHRYERARVQIVLGQGRAVDFEHNRLTLDDDQSLPWDRLLLATGSQAQVPDIQGAQLDGVLTCRSWDDARAIREIALAAAQSLSPVVIVGGGILGLELAHTCHALGARVELIVRESHLGHPLFRGVAAERILDRLGEAGVSVHLDEQVIQVVGDEGRVRSVVTDRVRRVACAAVVFAVGVQPRVDMLRGSVHERGGVVQVDETLRTKNPDLFAAGDVARVWDPGLQRALPIRSWGAACRSGLMAGANMAGADRRFLPSRTVNASRVFDLPYALIGETNADDTESIVASDNRGPHAHRQVLLRDGVLVGAVLLQDMRGRRVYETLMRQGLSVARHRERLFEGDATHLLPEGDFQLLV